VRRLFRLPATEATIEREIDDELAFHFEAAVEDGMERGLSRTEAEERARQDFGDLDGGRRELAAIDRRALRRERRTDLLGGLIQDGRFAWRMLRQAPGFAATAIATLGLAIGATVAIFTVVDAALFRPLPYPAPDELTAAGFAGERSDDSLSDVDYATYQRWAARRHALRALGTYTIEGYEVRGGAQPVRAQALAVSSTLLGVLGVEPALGRGLTPAADEPGAPREVLLGHDFWRRSFGGDRGVLGRTLFLDHQPYEVVGVLPARLELPPPIRANGRWSVFKPDLWVGAGTLEDLHDRGGFFVLGRLRPGAVPEAAQADLRASESLAALPAIPATSGKAAIATTAATSAPVLAAPNRAEAARRLERLRVVRLHEQLAAPVRPAFFAFAGAVALLLLIACINLGSLLLARMTTRGRELAVRTALGAGRGRLVQQLLVEAALLSLLGGAAGVLLAGVSLRLLQRAAPADLPQLRGAALDGRALLFTFALSLVTAVLFGIVPALRASRERLQRAAAAGGRDDISERATRRTHAVLITTEIALAVALLVGAGLLLRTFWALLLVHPGFDAAGLST
jgi:predicted permease